MKKNAFKTLSIVTGASVLLAGCAQSAPAEPAELPAAPAAEAAAPAAPAPVTEAAMEALGATVSLREEETFAKVANVQGEFSFNQDDLTPSDEVFSLFGTAATAVCAAPGFAFDEVDHENYYINFGGAVKKTETVSLAALKEQQSESRVLKCSCSTSTPVANARVIGVPLENVMQMVELEKGANTITFKGADGYGEAMPLSYALDRHALLVYQVGETPVPSGVQVWVPMSVARYFTRNVADVSSPCRQKNPLFSKPTPHSAPR